MIGMSEAMDEYRVQIQRGYLQVAYQGLMQFFRDLRLRLAENHPEYSVAGSIYYGYMDMTFLTMAPQALRDRRLKIVVVFIHDSFRFEIWLSGANRDVQQRCWGRLAEIVSDEYRLAPDPRAEDYVVARTLLEDPDFADLEALAALIEERANEFVEDVQDLVSRTGN